MTYGLFAIGQACVALPLTAVREVTPCPDQLAALPTSAPGLLGAVNLRHQVVPVLDLQALDNPPGQRSDSRRVIVVMLFQGRLLGLAVDGVHGVTAPEALREVGGPGQRLPISHTFTSAENGDIVSVLDVEMLFALPGIPLVEDDRAGGEGAFGDQVEHRLEAADLSGSILLVRCSEHRLAVNIDAVHTIVPRVQVRNSPLRQGSCRGVTDYGGAEVAVFDPLVMAGLGELSSRDTEGVAIRFHEGVVVMLLSEVLELIPASSAQRFALPAVPMPGRKYLDGVVRVPDRGDFLSLAVPEILGHEDLKALSRLNTPHTGGSADTVPAQRSGENPPESAGEALAGGTYLTFSVHPAAADLAVPLSQVIEILPFPERYSVLQAGDETVLGLFTHRDNVVPLIRLAALLDLGHEPEHSQYLLLVSTQPGLVGLAVHALRAIERSVWEDPAASARPAGSSLPEALARRWMIRLAAIGTSDEPRMLSRIDLAAIGSALVPPSPTETATATAAGTG